MDYNEQDGVKYLQDLFSRSCTILRAGALMRANNGPDFLDQLQKILYDTVLQNHPITPNRTAKNYGVRVRKICGIKENKEEDDTICIEIRQNVAKEWHNGKNYTSCSEKGSSRVLLLTLLTSCGFSNTHELRRAKKTSKLNLPVCIYRGQPAVWKTVQTEIYRHLNCLLVTHDFNEDNVKVMSALCLMEGLQTTVEKSKIKYDLIPIDGSKLPPIQMQMHVETWLHMWERSVNDGGENMQFSNAWVQNILKTWNAMVLQVCQDSDNDPGLLAEKEVYKICMRYFSFSLGGKAKLEVFSFAYVRLMLMYLTRILTGADGTRAPAKKRKIAHGPKPPK